MVDATTGQASDLNVEVEWAPPVQGPARGGQVGGWRRSGVLSLPPTLKDVGAVLVRKKAAAGSKGEALDFIDKVVLKR